MGLATLTPCLKDFFLEENLTTIEVFLHVKTCGMPDRSELRHLAAKGERLSVGNIRFSFICETVFSNTARNRAPRWNSLRSPDFLFSNMAILWTIFNVERLVTILPFFFVFL